MPPAAPPPFHTIDAALTSPKVRLALGVHDAGAGSGVSTVPTRAPRYIGLRFSPDAADTRDRVLGVCAAGAPDETRCPGHRLDFAATSLGRAPVCCLACGGPIFVSVVKTGGVNGGARRQGGARGRVRRVQVHECGALWQAGRVESVGWLSKAGKKKNYIF